MTESTVIETIDITPTWAAVIEPTMALLMSHSTRRDTAEAKADAMKELRRMARIADKYVELAKRAGGSINLEQAVDQYVIVHQPVE